MKNANKMMDFRPISLCNVFYKIIAKTLPNRLKGVLPSILMNSKGVLCPTNLLLIMCLLPLNRSSGSRRVSSRGEKLMAAKLDMSKACNRVEWDFLKWMLNKLSGRNNYYHKRARKC